MINCQEDLFREEYCKYRFKHGKRNIYKEVPVFSRSVDLVEYNAHTKEITAIEFKINDWKRALNQLLVVSPCFDYLVLCYPKPKTEKCLNQIRSSCIRRGVGLVLWDSKSNTFSNVCDAQGISALWDVQKLQIITYIKNQKAGKNHDR